MDGLTKKDKIRLERLKLISDVDAADYFLYSEKILKEVRINIFNDLYSYFKSQKLDISNYVSSAIYSNLIPKKDIHKYMEDLSPERILEASFIESFPKKEIFAIIKNCLDKLRKTHTNASYIVSALFANILQNNKLKISPLKISNFIVNDFKEMDNIYVMYLIEDLYYVGTKNGDLACKQLIEHFIANCKNINLINDVAAIIKYYGLYNLVAFI